MALERTVFFATGGGRPRDTGELTFAGTGAEVTDVAKDRDGVVWHTVSTGSVLPDVGQDAHGVVDWRRRYLVMRLHTAQHIMNGIIWRDHGAHVTGAQITPPKEGSTSSCRPCRRSSPVRSRRRSTRSSNRIYRCACSGCRASRPTATVADPSQGQPHSRSIDPLRVIDIVGLDRQADGGTHVSATGEVGRVRVVKTESKGRANKRVRIAVDE